MVTRILFLSALLATFDVSGVQLRLKNQVYRGPVPTSIDQLFEVDGDNAEQVAKLGLSWSDSNGWNPTETLLQQVKKAGFSLDIKGAERIWLALCEPLNVASLARKVKFQLLALLPDYSKVTGIKAKKGSDACVPLDATVVDSKLEFTGRLATSLASSHELNDGSKISVWWQVDYTIQAPVARQSISRGEAIEPTDYGFEWIEAKGYALQQPLEQNALANARAKKAIIPGEVITEQNSEWIPVVEKGEKVKLFVTTGAITIETDAKALQSGNVDDVILVKADQAERPVKGKIVDSKVVYVHD